MTTRTREKGFTLIELLVVISIIGLLSSIVLASLNSGRQKAKDAYIISEVEQMRTLLEENANDYGDSANLQPHQWFGGPNGIACAAGNFAGNYAPQAVSVCQAIVNANLGVADRELYLGEQTVAPQRYSVMARLPSKGTLFCMGSNGQSSSIDTGGGVGAWTSPGCFADPTL